jgi:pimeloyl-ACP methyl ester carboxylesterase
LNLRMPDISHRFLEVNGLRMHIAEAGSGPLVLLLHGFPECWYSWRHQLNAVSEAGYHLVAPDQRGYCRSDRPERVDSYTLHHLVGDVVGLMDELEEEQAVVVGHDWGAPVAWHTALMRPDRTRGVAGLSVPYRPRGRANTPPLDAFRSRLGESFYQVYFQEPGVADAELARDVRLTFRRLLYAASGDATGVEPRSLMFTGSGGTWLDDMPEPSPLPSWLTEKDLETFAVEFENSGFTGGLNWYRNINRNWELTAAWQGARVQTPALYVAGDRDLVISFPQAEKAIAGLRAFVPDLRRTLILPGCGHWTQQERPDEVNHARIEFLGDLAAP